MPYRDNNAYFLNPNKRGYDGNRKFGEEILALSEKDAVVLADFTIFAILNYLTKVEGMRPDITLIPCDKKTNLRKRIYAVKRERPDAHVYLADNESYYNFKGFEERYVMKKYASFFEITPR